MKDNRDIDEHFQKMIMARSPQERLAMACRMFDTAKALVRARIEKEYGSLPPDKLREHIFLRLYGRDLGESKRAAIISYWSVDRKSDNRTGAPLV